VTASAARASGRVRRTATSQTCVDVMGPPVAPSLPGFDAALSTSARGFRLTWAPELRLVHRSPTCPP
jgi:hypothetical protein